MRGLMFTLTCPQCGSAVRYVNGNGNGLSVANAVVECVDKKCHREWTVSVALRAMERYKTSWDYKQERATA
jgi:hypothetical protein